MSLLSTISGMFGGGKSNVLGIDMGSSSIKVVELTKKGETIALQTYGEIALAPYVEKPVGDLVTLEPNKIAEALTELLSKIQVTTRQAVVSIPASASLVFVIELPKGSESSLTEIVPNEARKFIPVPLTEVTLDWLVVPDVYMSPDMADEELKKGEQKLRVLIAATRNEAIAQYTNILAQANITPLAFELEPFALVRACIKRELSPIAILDMGASKTKVDVVHHGVVFTTQVLGRGSHALTQSIARTLNLSFEKAEHLKRTEGGITTHAELKGVVNDYTKQVFAEVSSVLSHYEKEYHHAIEKMIIVGGGALVPGFIDIAKSSVTMDVHMSDAFGIVSAPEFLQSVLKNIDPSFALSIGLALNKLNHR